METLKDVDSFQMVTTPHARKPAHLQAFRKLLRSRPRPPDTLHCIERIHPDRVNRDLNDGPRGRATCVGAENKTHGFTNHAVSEPGLKSQLW